MFLEKGGTFRLRVDDLANRHREWDRTTPRALSHLCSETRPFHKLSTVSNVYPFVGLSGKAILFGHAMLGLACVR